MWKWFNNDAFWLENMHKDNGVDISLDVVVY